MNWKEYTIIVENGPISFNDKLPTVNDADKNLKIQVFMKHPLNVWGYAQVDIAARPSLAAGSEWETLYWTSFAIHWLPMPPSP